MTIDGAAESTGHSRMRDLVPAPVSARPDPYQDFRVGASTLIRASGEAAAAGEYLAELLRPATGYRAARRRRRAGRGRDRARPDRRRTARRTGFACARPPYGCEGSPAGLFAGVQTLRQLLPAAVDAPESRPGPWDISGGEVVDQPRFAHRGTMLDVARHFFTVAEVKKFIDEIARYKLNVLHLHLTDDQGWRIEIRSWPRLAAIGGGTQIGGGPAGFFTQSDYREIVATRRPATSP